MSNPILTNFSTSKYLPTLQPTILGPERTRVAPAVVLRIPTRYFFILEIERHKPINVQYNRQLTVKSAGDMIAKDPADVNGTTDIAVNQRFLIT